jgi:outer membrane lipoprotein SlyB
MKRFVPIIVAVLLAGPACAADPVGPTGTVSECRNCGTVRSIEQVDKSGQASGAGLVLGAVIGGVVGHQFGSGRGQDAATAAGAVGGAAAGHQIEKQRKSGSYFQVLVKMDGGGTESINVSDPSGLRVGARVRVSGRNLEVLEG